MVSKTSRCSSVKISFVAATVASIGVTVVEPLLGSKSLYLGGSQVETIRYMDAEVAKTFAAFDG